MHRLLVGTLIALAASGTALADSNCSPSGLLLREQHASIERVAKAMNDEGLRDFRQLDFTGFYPSDVAVSPMAEWYTRIMIGMGTTSPPSEEMRNGTRGFIRYLNARRGYDLTNSIFVDDIITTYDERDVEAMHDSTCAVTIRRHWALPPPGSQAPGTPYGVSVAATPVDASIVEWVRQHTPNIPALQLGGSVSDILSLLVGPVYVDHPFNALTALSAKATFDIGVRTYKTTKRYYYDDGSITGLRLDSTDGRLSLYLLAGSNEAVKALQSSLDTHHWEAMKVRFVQRPTLLGDISAELTTITSII